MLLFCGQACSVSVLLVLVTQTADAVRLVSNTSLPTNLTQSCASALLDDVECSPVVTALRIGSYYPQSTLNTTCTTQCANALSQYQAAVASACREQTWTGYEDTVMPLVVIPDLQRYLFDLTCLMDSNRYCNVVAAEAAFTSDPASTIFLSCIAASALDTDLSHPGIPIVYSYTRSLLVRLVAC